MKEKIHFPFLHKSISTSRADSISLMMIFHQALLPLSLGKLVLPLNSFSRHDQSVSHFLCKNQSWSPNHGIAVYALRALVVLLQRRGWLWVSACKSEHSSVIQEAGKPVFSWVKVPTLLHPSNVAAGLYSNSYCVLVFGLAASLAWWRVASVAAASNRFVNVRHVDASNFRNRVRYILHKSYCRYW